MTRRIWWQCPVLRDGEDRGRERRVTWLELIQMGYGLWTWFTQNLAENLTLKR